MSVYKTTLISLLTVFLLSGTACKTFVVEDVNYAQQIESVLQPDENGMVNDIRHGIHFSILPFNQQEFGQLDTADVEEVHLIRNEKGYYFITANQYKHVYVMKPGKGKLKLTNKIQVSEEGLSAAAFNLRSPFVELVDMKQEEVLTINEKGIQHNKEEAES